MKPKKDKAGKAPGRPPEETVPAEQPGDIERETRARTNDIEREDPGGPVE